MQDARQQGPGVFDGKSANAAAFFQAIDAHIGRRAAFFDALDETARRAPRGFATSTSEVASPEQQASARARSLWLDIVTQEESYLFELSAQNERAIVVGSFQQADVRIPDARVEPVELHFEREGNAVCVVPAYGSTIEVNAIRLRRPRRIVDRAIVEFQGHVLRVRVLDDPRWCSEVTPRDAPLTLHGSSAPAEPAEETDSEVTLTRLAPGASEPPPRALSAAPSAALAGAALAGSSVPSTAVATLRVARLQQPAPPSSRVVALAVALALLIGFLFGQLSPSLVP